MLPQIKVYLSLGYMIKLLRVKEAIKMGLLAIMVGTGIFTVEDSGQVLDQDTLIGWLMVSDLLHILKFPHLPPYPR